MDKKPLLIEIGIWTILLAVIFSALIFVYSKFFVEPNVYTIEFKDIDGITKGSPVRFMGLNVGYVRNLKSKDKHINVQIIITKKDMKIPNGTVARVEFYGLGGSKSVELMPPDGSCDVGILTGDTLRLSDVTGEIEGLVEIAEFIEEYVKGIDSIQLQRFLEVVSDIKDNNIKDLGESFTFIKGDIVKKAKNITSSQEEMNQKIQKMNDNIEKINRFIKKWFYDIIFL